MTEVALVCVGAGLVVGWKAASWVASYGMKKTLTREQRLQVAMWIDDGIRRRKEHR